MLAQTRSRRPLATICLLGRSHGGRCRLLDCRRCHRRDGWHTRKPAQSEAAAPSGYDIFARLRVWSSAGASAERSLIMESEEVHNDGSTRKRATPPQDCRDADQAVADDAVVDTTEHDDPSNLSLIL
ncbi:hypothetical protein pclt_cds_424b [Pandoravirus celtis]|uniref:Uncharacterized protein n=1 Tax=Pandoravirus celtis TaxID=2568002 RepID=A0A4D6EII3_9VIRU|nr:hypothetical protein pclt_cds_424b [Pandoravirus celtis]